MHASVGIVDAEAGISDPIVGTMMYHLGTLLHIWNHGWVILTQAEAEESQHHGVKFLLCYQHLATVACNKNICAWKLRPKLHYFAHIILEITETRENPVKQDLFGAEDIVL